jgi:hypothetical protein
VGTPASPAPTIPPALSSPEPLGSANRRRPRWIIAVTAIFAAIMYVAFTDALAKDTIDSFCASLGATPFGFAVGSVVLCFVNAGVVHLLRNVWGWAMKMSEWKRDFVASFMVMLCLWVPIYAYFRFFALPQKINSVYAESMRNLKPMKTVLPLPRFAFEKSQRLEVSLVAKNDFTFTPRMGDIVTPEFLKDRRQYILGIKNLGPVMAKAISLRMQFPYPVERAELADYSVFSNPAMMFRPLGLQWGTGGAGKTEITRTPITTTWQLLLPEMDSGGVVYILILLNSWRDPRGKTITPSEQGRYFVPDWGPTTTYVNGEYRYSVNGREVLRHYYAPMTLGEDKIVRIGAEDVPPRKIMLVEGMQ